MLLQEQSNSLIVKFPKDFILPGFKKWLVGDKQQKVGPFKNLRAPDIPRSSASLKSARKRLSDWRFVMTYYESKLDEIEGCPTNCPLLRRRWVRVLVYYRLYLSKPCSKFEQRRRN